MKVRRLLAGTLALAAVAVARPADAVVVERVVAVVGERAFLLSELRQRARPFLVQLHARCPIGTPSCIPAENKIYAQLLDRMVEEELESQAAKRTNVTVTARDVDQTLERIAGMNGMTLSQLYADVRRQSGMSEAEYRQEIRRQVLEGKLLQRMVQNQIRITRQELEAMYRRVVDQERRILLYQPSWIVLRVGDQPDPEVIAAARTRAEEIVRLARDGSDFGQLARQFSQHPEAEETAGDLGVRAPDGSPAAMRGNHSTLAEELEKVAMTLEPGEVSEPFIYRDALVVMKLMQRQPSRYPSFDAAAPEMVQRVQSEKLEKAKEKWLLDLRRRTHVDVRL